MSLARARVRTLYVLITLNVVLLIALVFISVYVANLRQRVNTVAERSHAGCVRGNVLRDNTRENTIVIVRILRIVIDDTKNQEIRVEFQKVVPELLRRIALPQVQHQPCDKLYPS